MNEYLDYSSNVRKNLIDMLMFSLYPDERTIYREYVQNALDSINRAVKLGILAESKDGVVHIDINNKQKSITIRDNGTGIEKKDAVQILLDVSSSTKDGVTEAGFYGIGRLVGGGYCRELIFTTSAKNEDLATRITFDVDHIWQMVKKDKENYLATEVIDKCTKREHIPANLDEHFFEVQLNQVKKEYASVLLNPDIIINYLNIVAPVEYKSQFNNILIYGSTEKNRKFRELHEGLEKIQLFVGTHRIQKQYGLEIAGNHDKIHSLEYFTIFDPDFGQLGWGWFALTRYTVQIPREDDLAGLRLRIHNIQIGDSYLLSGKPLWSEERGNSYFYGEIFATHPNIRPDSARNGLAPTSESKAFYSVLESYFKELKQVYTKANEAKKAIEKIYQGLERLKSAGIGDYKGWDDIDNKGIAKFEQLENRTSFGPAVRMLDLYREDYSKAKNQVNELKNNKLNSDTPQSPATTPKKYGTEEDLAFSSPKVSPKAITHPVETPNPKSSSPVEYSQEENDVNDENGPQSMIKEEPQIVDTRFMPTPQPMTRPILQPLKKDLLATLNGILDKSEIWIIRRVFKVLTENCPGNDHDKRLIEELKHLIVREFSNGN